MRLLLIPIAALSLLTACGGSEQAPDASSSLSTAATSAAVSPTTESPSEDADATSTEAAKTVAQEEADRYSAGDYGGAWQLWTKEAQAVFSKADYEKLHAACPGPGASYTIENVRIDSPGNAVARLAVMGFKMAYDLKYEDGAWRWQPPASDMKDYAEGVDKVIAKAKADGSC